MRYNVVVVGSNTAKGTDGKYLPLPQENVDFIEKVLSMLPDNDYAAVYHGADDKGVDLLVEKFATTRGIRQRQYPAYWFNPGKPNNTDKAAGFFRNERMVRDAKSAQWVPTDVSADNVNPNVRTVVIAFHNRPLTDDPMTAQVLEVARKVGLPTREYALPVQLTAEATTQQPTADAIPFG